MQEVQIKMSGENTGTAFLKRAENTAAPPAEVLWPMGAPGAKGDSPGDRPQISFYLPEAAKSSGAAVVICPGGGYAGLAMGHEGHEIACWLNALGIAGIVLDYRHRGKGYGHPAPSLDAARAIRTARARAMVWKLDPQRIGVLGFSAGGHLAATVATRFDRGDAKSSDPIERMSSRPDFAILCYPVIALGEPFAHGGSQENLLGKTAPEELVRSLSSEKQVTQDTPPTFLWHTSADACVPPENSVQFYLALQRAGVPAELHIFEHGQHGLGLAAAVPGTSAWPRLCEKWLRGRGVLRGEG